MSKHDLRHNRCQRPKPSVALPQSNEEKYLVNVNGCWKSVNDDVLEN